MPFDAVTSRLPGGMTAADWEALRGNIERIEDNRVVLDCSADRAKHDWRDEDRSRSLGEREDQGEMGPHILNRSFEGTYR